MPFASLNVPFAFLKHFADSLDVPFARLEHFADSRDAPFDHKVHALYGQRAHHLQIQLLERKRPACRLSGAKQRVNVRRIIYG